MNVDLSSEWMGLKLRGPLVLGASPISEDVDAVRAIVDAGAAAVVMESLFEEQLSADAWAMHDHLQHGAETFAEAISYFPEPESFGLGPDSYLRQIERLKAAVEVPVVASLNGVSLGGWVHYARSMEDAGADALELNIYYVAMNPDESGQEVERRYFDIVSAVRQEVGIPITVKLSPFFSSLAYTARRLVVAGANGLTIFNRFYQPDIDVAALEAVPELRLSTPGELRLRLRWLAALHGNLDVSLAATGGVHSAVDAVKALMAGADVVQMTSAILRGGADHLAAVLRSLREWMEEYEYESVKDLVGCMSLGRSPDPAAFERANYMRVIRSWHGTPFNAD